MSESYDYSSNLNRLNEKLFSKLAQKLNETFHDLRELNFYSKKHIKDEPKETNVLLFESHQEPSDANEFKKEPTSTNIKKMNTKSKGYAIRISFYYFIYLRVVFSKILERHFSKSSWTKAEFFFRILHLEFSF
jgi:hypothetical protein